jgi:hypothetical protein
MVTAQERERTEACAARNFEVEIDDRAVGFSAVSGLGLEFDYADDGRLVTSRITEVTMRRGITGDSALWSWARRVPAASRSRAPSAFICSTTAARPSAPGCWNGRDCIGGPDLRWTQWAVRSPWRRSY